MSANPLELERVLLVEDDELCGEELRRFLVTRASIVDWSRSMAEAEEMLNEHVYDLVFLDLHLQDGAGEDLLDLEMRLARRNQRRLVAERAEGGPPDRQARPCGVLRVVVISGCESPERAFQLGKLCVRDYVRKPFTPARLDEAIAKARAAADLEPFVRQAVGGLQLDHIKEICYRTSIEEALGQSAGNLNEASRILGTSRQRLRQAVNTLMGRVRLVKSE